MSERFLIVASLIWLVGVLVAVQTSSASAKSPTLDVRGAAAIDRMFQAAIDKGEIPGVVAAITNKDEVLCLKAFRTQAVAQNVPMSKDTLFRIASMLIHSRAKSAGSYAWAGSANTHFRVDPRKGIAVVFLLQVLPLYDATCMDVMKRSRD